MQSYLGNGEHVASVNGTDSSTLAKDGGVPQGSILDPLLFKIYIDAIPEEIGDQLTK